MAGIILKRKPYAPIPPSRQWLSEYARGQLTSYHSFISFFGSCPTRISNPNNLHSDLVLIKSAVDSEPFQLQITLRACQYFHRRKCWSSPEVEICLLRWLCPMLHCQGMKTNYAQISIKLLPRMKPACLTVCCCQVQMESRARSFPRDTKRARSPRLRNQATTHLIKQLISPAAFFSPKYQFRVQQSRCRAFECGASTKNCVCASLLFTRCRLARMHHSS
jgi:hypothetical protein